MAAPPFSVVQYRQEVVLGFGQRSSLMRETTTRETVLKGATATFLVQDTVGNGSTRGVDGKVPYNSVSGTQVPCTLTENIGARRMTGFNIFSSQGNQQQAMQMEVQAEINRNTDLAIITALATGTLDTGAAATVSMGMIDKALVTLQNGGAPLDGQIFACVTPGFLAGMMALNQFASADFVEVKPFVAPPGFSAMQLKGMGQGWWRWKGANWYASILLSGVGTASETCLMYHRNAIGYAANSAEMEVNVGYDTQELASYANASLYHGAVLLQNAGVVRMIHDGSGYVAS